MPSFVQENDAQVRTGTSVGVTLQNAVTAGDLIVAYVIWDSTSAVSLADSQGNAYTAALGPTRWSGGRYSAEVFYAKNVAGGADTVTADFSTAITRFGLLYVHEYAGLDQTDPVDATAAATGASGSLDSGPVTTTAANDLLFGAAVSDNVVTAPGAGYTARGTLAGNMTEDMVAGAAGSYSATASQDGNQWAMQLVAFKAVATIATPTPGTTATATDTVQPTSTAVSSATNTPTATPVTTGMPSFPLQDSANHRYLVDQNGTPFLVVGDSPQDLIGNIPLSTAATYFADRQAQGFNAVWVNFPCGSYTWCNSDGSTYDGLQPFTTPGDVSTPNPAYFQRGQQMVALAAQYGFAVFLNVADTGSWLSLIDSNGQSKDYAFGQYLGTTFAADKNVIFMVGNDFQSWTNATDNTNVLAILQGIASTDPGALRTSELNYWESTSLDAAGSGQPNNAAWGQMITLDGVYTYSPTYEHIYADSGSAGMPMFIEETNYEYENNTGSDPSTPLRNRKEDYWGYLAGAAGYLFGNNCTARMGFQCSTPLGSTWQSNINSPGALQLSYCAALLRSVAWYNLVPDTDHAFLTAGYGTPDNGNVGENDYVTAALTADGTTGLMYDPNGYALTVDLAKMAGPVTARWFDPSNGTYVGISGSPFANSGSRTFTTPGNNSGGDPDWVLVLEAGPTATPSPTSTGPTATPAPVAPSFVQVAATTPQSPQSSVTLAYSQAQSAGDTNVVVIGWNDTTSTIRSVVDSAGNTYQAAAATARGNGISQAIYYAGHIAAAGPGANAVTITFNQAAASVDVRILEYSGLDQTSPFDVSASASGTSEAASSGAATTGAANELIVGAGTTTGRFSGAGPGFTSRIITAPDGDIGEDRSVTAMGSYSATAPLIGSAAWVMQMATFRAAS